MKILISCWQNNENAKGHFHPPLEIALECSRRGHEVHFLLAPNRPGPSEEKQLRDSGISFVTVPPPPAGVMKTAAELTELGKNPDHIWIGFRSLLVDHLIHQFEDICRAIEGIAPDILVYDLLSYGPPLAARKLGIPDFGFSANLKLVVDRSVYQYYLDVREKLRPDMEKVLSKLQLKADFDCLELLSPNGQAVFTTPGFVAPGARPDIPEKTFLVGPLLPSRGSDAPHRSEQNDFAVFSFGSMGEVADQPHVLQSIIEATGECGIRLMVGSRKLAELKPGLPSHVEVMPYLPLPQLLRSAKAFFYHGGANGFSEALAAGVPQILIPQILDQPIQGYLLEKSGAGFQIKTDQVSRESIVPLLRRALDPSDPIHSRIRKIAEDYRSNPGAARTVDLMEDVVRTRKR